MTVGEQVRQGRREVTMATSFEGALEVLKKWAAQEVRVTEFAGVDVQTETVRVRGMFAPGIREEEGERALILYANPAHNFPTTVHYMVESCFTSLTYESLGRPGGRLVVSGEYGRFEVELVPGGADARILHGRTVLGDAQSTVAYRPVPVEGNPRLVRADTENRL